MSLSNHVFTALMPVSQATGWYLITQASGSPSDLYSNVSKISLFYCAWALVNKYARGNAQELGHLSMGLLGLASYLKSKGFVVAATGLVIANFGVVAPLILVKWDAKTLANKLNKTVAWAYIFKGYFASCIVFWSTVLYKIIKAEAPNKGK